VRDTVPEGYDAVDETLCQIEPVWSCIK
jgi:hypothetical protein